MKHIRKIAEVIKYSSDSEKVSKVTASCSNTIAMDVCNNFHLPHPD